MTEIQSIMTEMKQLSIDRKELIKQKKILEKQVQDYLIQNNLKSVSNEDGNVTIRIQNKKTRVRLTKEERRKQQVDVLKQVGVGNADDVFEKLEKASKGEESPEVKGVKISIKT